MTFWALPFTALFYGFTILIISLFDPNNLSFLNQMRGFSFGIRLLILAAIAIVGLPNFMRAIRNTKSLVLAIDNNTNIEKDELANKIFFYTSGFEVICLIGLVAFLLGFPIMWSIVALIVGTLCKLYYIPIFLKLKNL